MTIFDANKGKNNNAIINGNEMVGKLDEEKDNLKKELDEGDKIKAAMDYYKSKTYNEVLDNFETTITFSNGTKSVFKNHELKKIMKDFEVRNPEEKFHENLYFNLSPFFNTVNTKIFSNGSVKELDNLYNKLSPRLHYEITNSVGYALNKKDNKSVIPNQDVEYITGVKRKAIHDIRNKSKTNKLEPAKVQFKEGGKSSSNVLPGKSEEEELNKLESGRVSNIDEHLIANYLPDPKIGAFVGEKLSKKWLEHEIIFYNKISTKFKEKNDEAFINRLTKETGYLKVLNRTKMLIENSKAGTTPSQLRNDFFNGASRCSIELFEIFCFRLKTAGILIQNKLDNKIIWNNTMNIK